jgi:hypothetical protein
VVVDCLQTTTEGGYRKSILLDCCGNKLWTCNREPKRIDDADSISPLHCLLNCLDPRHTTARLHGSTKLFRSLALAQTPLAIPFPSRERLHRVRHLSSRIFFFPIAHLALGRQQKHFKFFVVWTGLHCRISSANFFLFWLLWYSHSDNHPHEDLARFGYWTSTTVKTNLLACCCWRAAGAGAFKSGESSPKTLLYWRIFSKIK